MRSRPTIETFITPKVPVPGAPIVVRAKLNSRSETPIDGVELRLTGVERRYSHTRSSGDSSSRVYKTTTHVSLAANVPPQKLGVGSVEFQARFDLPPGLPPSYSDEFSDVRYRLDVHVHIPWWPDRRESYEIKILPPAWRATPAGPTVFATNSDGPQADKLYIEATLDPQSAFLGGALRGAVSLANVSKKLKHVTIGLAALNQATFASSTPIAAVRRYQGKLFEVQPVEGAATPFSIQIPATEWPSFKSSLFNHLWSFEIRGVMSWSEDVDLAIPIMVAPEAPAAGAGGQLQRLPPVGHERRAKVWAFVAQQLDMQNDAASEVMTTTVGAVEIRIELEQRDKHGLCSVATLSWPSAGIDLSVSERKWTDALRRHFETGDAGFDDRFSLRAREDAQARAFVTPTLLGALRDVAQAVVEDDGAILAAPGGGHRLDKLERFVEMVRRLGSSVDRALSALPPPAAALNLADAWQRYAAEREARLERGSLSLRRLVFEGVPIDVVNQWTDSGAHQKTTIAHELDETSTLDSTAAKSALEEGRTKHGIQLEGRSIHASVDTLRADPRELEPVIAAVAKVARSMRPRAAHGPYR